MECAETNQHTSHAGAASGTTTYRELSTIFELRIGKFNIFNECGLAKPWL
jgi:hypothetical protein